MRFNSIELKHRLLCVIPSFMLVLLMLTKMSASSSFTNMSIEAIVYVSIFFWCVFMPQLLPSLLLFGFGLFFDLLLYSPFGLHAFLFLAIRLFLHSKGYVLMRQSFFKIWENFIYASLICQILSLTVHFFYYDFQVGFIDALWSFCLMVILFPIVYVPLLQVLYLISQNGVTKYVPR